MPPLFPRVFLARAQGLNLKITVPVAVVLKTYVAKTYCCYPCGKLGVARRTHQHQHPAPSLCPRSEVTIRHEFCIHFSVLTGGLWVIWNGCLLDRVSQHSAHPIPSPHPLPGLWWITDHTTCSYSNTSQRRNNLDRSDSHVKTSGDGIPGRDLHEAKA